MMALPSLMQLQSCGFEVRAVGRGWAKELLAGVDIPVTGVKKGIFPAARALKALDATRGLLFTNSLSSALSMRLAGIAAIGYRADCRSLLLHAALQKSSRQHEVEYFWRLGQAAAACWGGDEMPWPAAPPRTSRLRLTNFHLAAAARALVSAKIHGPYLVLCPMAVGSVNGRPKRWPHFERLCQKLSSDGHKIVICPGPGEDADAEVFRKSAFILPNISIGIYAAIIAGADATIANDSGPMHIAAAVGTPVLGIFGTSDPTRTSPWGGQYVGSKDGWPDLDEVLAAFEALLESRSSGTTRLPMAA